MDIGNVLKLFMIILGVFILIKTVVSLAKRQMTEQFYAQYTLFSASHVCFSNFIACYFDVWYFFCNFAG